MPHRWEYFALGPMEEIGLEILKCRPAKTQDDTTYDIRHLCHDSDEVIQMSHQVISNKQRHHKSMCVRCAAKLRGMIAKRDREQRAQEKAELEEEERRLRLHKDLSQNYRLWKKAMMKVARSAA